MIKFVRIVVIILFWLFNLWWLASVYKAMEHLPETRYRVYSVENSDLTLEARGLTFVGESGIALGIAYFVLVIYALLGSVLSKGIMWIGSMLILLAWAGVFAGNSWWLEKWTPFEWWDAVNYGGFAVAVLCLLLNFRGKVMKVPAKPGG